MESACTLPAIVAREYGIRPIRISKVTGGEQALASWVAETCDRRLLIKRVGSSRHLSDALSFANWLNANGLRAQRTLQTMSGTPCVRDGILLREYVPGQVGSLGALVSHRDVGNMGGLLARLHLLGREFSVTDKQMPAIDHAHATSTYAQALDMLTNQRQASAHSTTLMRFIDRNLDFIQAAPFAWAWLESVPATVVHGDFHQANVVNAHDEDCLAVIDLDECARGPRVWEYAKSAVRLAAMTPGELFIAPVSIGKLESFASAYNQVWPLSSAEVSCLPQLVTQAVATATYTIETRLLRSASCPRPLRFPSSPEGWTWWNRHSRCVVSALTGSSRYCGYC